MVGRESADSETVPVGPAEGEMSWLGVAKKHAMKDRWVRRRKFVKNLEEKQCIVVVHFSN